MRWTRILQVSSVFLLFVVSGWFHELVCTKAAEMAVLPALREDNEKELVQKGDFTAHFASKLSHTAHVFLKRALPESLPRVLSAEKSSYFSKRRRRNSEKVEVKEFIHPDSSDRNLEITNTSEERYVKHESSTSSLITSTSDNISVLISKQIHIQPNNKSLINLRTTVATLSANTTVATEMTTKSDNSSRNNTKDKQIRANIQNDSETSIKISTTVNTNEEELMDEANDSVQQNVTAFTENEPIDKSGNFTFNSHFYNSTLADSNSINDSNNNTFTSTMNLTPETLVSPSTFEPEHYTHLTNVDNENVDSISPPLLSSNSAIASDPTVESIGKNRDAFGVGAIIGIAFGSVILVILIAGLCGFIIYNRRLRPLSDVKYPTDNCGYVDDSLRVSYMNNHIELPKESSEEMFSLDNDSFLNSLEAMTLQNYWAEDAKNTKV